MATSKSKALKKQGYDKPALRTITTAKHKVEQFDLGNGKWAPNKRWNLKTGKREL